MGANYTITGQTEVVQLGDSGPVRAMQVTFKTTDTNVTGTVTIPLADYGAATVGREIEKYVANISAVHALGTEGA